MTWTQTFIGNLTRLGFYDFILPWLFAFAVVYALLVKIGLFSKEGEEGKRVGVNGLIAIVVAFYVTVYTPYGTTLSSWFIGTFGSSIIFMSVAFLFLLFAGMVKFGMTKEEEKKGAWSWKNLKPYVWLLVLLILAYLFFLGYIGISVPSMGISFGELWSILFVVAIFVVAVMFVQWEKGGKKAS